MMRRPGVGAARRGGFRGIGDAVPSILADLDFTTLSAGAVSTLPGTLSFARSGDAYSVQTSASALLVQTFADNVARAGSNDGTIGLVIEEARTQLAKRTAEMSTFPPWSTSGTANRNVSSHDGPDGSTNTAKRQTCNSGARVLYYDDAASDGGLTLTNATRYAASLWNRGNAGGESWQIAIVNGGLTNGKAAGGTFADTAWARRSLTVVAGTDTATDLTDFFAACFGDSGATANITGGVAAAARDAINWGFQCEAGGFATEYIPATAAGGVARNGERLYDSNAAQYVRSGRLKLEIQCKPKGASSRYSADMYLWLCGSDYARIDYATGAIVISIGGSPYTTPVAMSWSEGDTVDLYVEAGGSQPTYVVYRVNGGTRTLLSTGSPASLGNIDNTGAVDFLCNGTSNQFTCWLRRLTVYA